MMTMTMTTTNTEHAPVPVHAGDTFEVLFTRLVEARGLHEVPVAPRARDERVAAEVAIRAEHGAPDDGLARLGFSAMVSARVAETGRDRHAARVAAASQRLRDLADALIEASAMAGWPARSTYCEEQQRRDIIATLLGNVISRGRGGPGDMGGPDGASSLPIVPHLRHKAQWGWAWVSAFAEATRQIWGQIWGECQVPGHMELWVDYGGDLGVSAGGHHFPLEVGIVHPDVWRLLAAPGDPGVHGDDLPVRVVVPPFGALEFEGQPCNHPYLLAGAIALGRQHRKIHVLDGDGRD